MTHLMWQIQGFHDGTMKVVRFDELEGLVSLPSFHVAGALIVTWAFRNRVRILIPLILLNVALTLSTFITRRPLRHRRDRRGAAVRRQPGGLPLVGTAASARHVRPPVTTREFWAENADAGLTRPARLKRKRLERETGFEPATSTLARSHSTTELFPHETFRVPHGRVGLQGYRHATAAQHLRRLPPATSG